MRHWLQLATRNWRTKPARTGLALLAIALGVAVVVWVTCCYESVRRSVTAMVLEWIGRSHIIVEPVEGRWAVFDEGIEPKIAALPGIERTTRTTQEFVEVAPVSDTPPAKGGQGGGASDSPPVKGGQGGGVATPRASSLPSAPPDYAYRGRIEAKGILPGQELSFRAYHLAAGRFLTAADPNALVAETALAKDMGFDVGDTIFIRDDEPPQPARPFKVVGLIERRRASLNQLLMVWMSLPDVQSISKLPGSIKTVDIILSDRRPEAIQQTADAVRQLITDHNAQRQSAGLQPESLKVSTTQAQHQRLGAAQGLLHFIMLLLACVVLLTAFFIIVATMNMSVLERIRELGLLRCVGMTRRQLCAQVMMETAPLGFAGVLLGVPMGFALQWLTLQLVREYVGEMAVHRWGLLAAVVGGLGTTLLGAAAPAWRAMSVSPVEATRPLAGKRRFFWVWMVALTGIILLGAHEFVKHGMSGWGPETFNALALLSLVLLYAGFACLMPAVIAMLGRVAVVIAGFLLRLQPQLLGDEIDKAPFRSAAISCGLTVGLSLIVGLVVWGESVKQGWQFPKEFPEAILYCYQKVPLDKAAALRDIPGLAEFSAAGDFQFSLEKPRGIPLLGGLKSAMKKGVVKSVLEQTSRFIAIDPDTAFNVVKLTYLEGNRKEALAKLKKGKHILVTREFAEARKVHKGDAITLWVDSRHAKLTIAGVVTSPGLDIAISFFNAAEYYQFYAVGAVIGTQRDADRLFDRKYATLLFFNYTPAVSRAAAEHAAKRQATTEKAPPTASPLSFGATLLPGNDAEEQIVNQMLIRLKRPIMAYVTASQLKQQINTGINNVTLLLSAIPLVGLIVAALGIANLMTANVASRTMQIAVLRAIGATRGQILRMVIGEALILGLLGSAVGVILGAWLGHTSNFMTELLTSYRPRFAIPWHLVTGGALLGTALCVLAALLPARHAARSNIIAALGDA